MTPPISDFFDIDLIEEQHLWKLSEIAFFYQVSEEEVKRALKRANERLRTNPFSINYEDTNSNSDGCSSDALSTPPCGHLQCDAGQSGVEVCEDVASGGSSP